MGIRVLVCGGRDYSDKERVCQVLDDFCTNRSLWDVGPDGNALPTGLTIIHGAARGADRLADYWAVNSWVPVEEYKPDWDTYGKAAGILRNIDMLDSGVDVVIAFPGGRGTAHMIKIAKEKGVEVIEIG